MDRREDLLRTESDVWAAFAAELERVPRDRREEPGLPEGWSVKDLLWHIACWARELPTILPQVAAGTFVSAYADDEVVERRNAEILVEARRLPLGEAEDAVTDARAGARAAFEALDEVDETAAEWFDAETIDHYRDHIGDLKNFAASLEG